VKVFYIPFLFLLLGRLLVEMSVYAQINQKKQNIIFKPLFKSDL
jgi:hypothetical protein